MKTAPSIGTSVRLQRGWGAKPSAPSSTVTAQPQSSLVRRGLGVAVVIPGAVLEIPDVQALVVFSFN